MAKPLVVMAGLDPRVKPEDRLRPSSAKGCDFFLDHRLKTGDDIVDATTLCGLKAKFTFH